MATTSDYQEHVHDLEKEVDELKETRDRDREVIRGLLKELEFAKEQHAQTLARKSNVMQDWLADQTKWKLRCQLREAGHEPLV